MVRYPGRRFCRFDIAHLDQHLNIQDSKPSRVRRNAIEALGTIGSFASSTVDLLGQKLADPDYRVRRNAAISLAKSGSQASPVISMLTTALNDEDRYNRFYAALALQHIGTNSAKDILLDALFTARWCPITTVDNLY